MVDVCKALEYLMIKNFIIGTLLAICVASMFFIHYLTLKQDVGFGVYNSDDEALVFNYENRSIPFFSHNNSDIIGRLHYSLEYEGRGEFSTWRNRDACGITFKATPQWNFVIPRNSEYRVGEIQYKRVDAETIEAFFKNYGQRFETIKSYRAGKVYQKIIFDRQIGIRYFEIYNEMGTTIFSGTLTDGDGFLKSCARFSLDDYF